MAARLPGGSRLLAGATGLLLLLAAQVLGAGPAAAHTALVATSPAAEATVAEPPVAVTLTFTQPVSTRLSTVVVTGPDGDTWSSGPAGVTGATVTQRLGALGPAGGYTVAWRVVAADGHPVTGTFGFTLATAGSGPPVSAAVAAAPDSRPARPDEAPASGVASGDSGADRLPLAGGLAGAVLVAAVVALLSRRQRAAGPTGG